MTTFNDSKSRTRRVASRLLAGAALIASGLLLWPGAAYSFGQSDAAVAIAPPAQDIPASSAGGAHSETAVFAGGCFWGVQGVFQHVKGVQRVLSGYTGGKANTAHYETVSGGDTGHAESVQIVYDPKQITYGGLLQIFFSVAHNPTELNRQGPDSGTQYRSAIFPADAAQQRVAQAYIAQLDAAKSFGRPLATRVETGATFYPAEAYHQDFLAKNPNHPYIMINDLPKIDHLKQTFPQRYRETPVLVGSSL